MDDKELIRRTKNSLRAKKSHGEILSGLQKRGYKPEYANEILSRAKRPKTIIITFLIIIFILFNILLSLFLLFSSHQKMNLENPLKNLASSQNSKKTAVVGDNNSVSNQTLNKDVKITPEIINFLLNEIGAWKLHKNPLTFEKPIMNFNIGKKKFYSEIGSEIKTEEGSSDKADIDFDINKKDLLDAISSDNPKKIFSDSLTSGRSSVEIKASKTELFAKGYSSFYNGLNL